MNAAARLGLYTTALAVAFAGALGVGRLVGPFDEPARHASDGAHAASDEESGAHDESGGHGESAESGGSGTAGLAPDGLQIASDGYRLAPVTTALPAGTEVPYRFRILGPDGAPVTRYTTSHEKDLHLIVVRRDLSGFQHLHPTLESDGTWAVPLLVPHAGQYRVFADFQPAGRADGLTLGVDVPAAGSYSPVPLPEPAHSTTVDGYTVTIEGDLVPGTASTLRLSVSRAGQPVTDLQPYLGAYGHLVALRDGDLAYLHVHPEATPGSGPTITFVAEVPSPGRYRLFLDFKAADGVVRTAALTAATDHRHG